MIRRYSRGFFQQDRPTAVWVVKRPGAKQKWATMESGPRPILYYGLGMTAATFLLLNLALAFYNVGTIWAHEVDIFRTWRLIDPDNFRVVQTTHWRKLRYWIFTPVGAAFIGGILLIWYHPAGSPKWAIWGNLACQLLAIVLTAALWGHWQAKLSKDPLGSQSPYLKKILATHWIRTLLINAYAFILLAWAVQIFASIG
jgi:hypothetical protein